ncbi:MAG: DMT family transporter [Chitinophagales bacterium]
MPQKISLQSWLYLATISVIWGSSFILIKKGLVVFEPTQLACLRIFLAMLAMSPLIFSSIKKIKRSDLLPIMAIAIIGTGIPAFLYATAQTQLDSSVAAILNSLTPLFTLIIGLLFFKTKVHFAKMIGVLLGLLGAINLVLQTSSNSTFEISNYFYAGLIIFGTMCYGTSINLLKTYAQHVPAIALNTTLFMIIGPFAGLYLFTATDFVSVMQTAEGAWQAFGYVCLLSVFGTALATIIFFKLAQLTDALFSSTVTYLIPIVALFWGFLDGEIIGLSHLLGLGLILLGVYLAGKS